MRRIGKALLSALFFLSVLFLLPLSVNASVKKKDTSRDIAIVFDNSGSMYTNSNKAWSEATYAIEVFASMLNDGDRLTVFPMNPVTIDGKEYSGTNPIVISKPSDAIKIERMVTPNSNRGDTPIDTIKQAYDGVKGSDKDEKWLLVLTDGAEFYDKDHKYVDCVKDNLEILSAPGTDDDGKISALKDSLTDSEKNEKATTVGAKRALSAMLSECAKDVNTLYLGIGSAAVKPEINGEYAYEPQQAESAEVPEVLGKMCNMIFGRNELDTDGNTITFDIPLSKLIAFIQGENIEDVTITGKSKLSPKEYQQVHYSEEGTEGGKWTTNNSLQGAISTYVDGLAKDEKYKLSYSGNESDTIVYYEPDVDLYIDIVDALGNSVISQPDIYAGDYGIVYTMVDSEGNDVSESELLGDTIYDIGFTLNGKKLEPSDNTKAGLIPLKLSSGDVLGFDKAEVTFLNNYTITKTAEDIGFLSGGNTIGEKPNTLSFEIVGGKDEYQRAKLEDEAKYEIKAFYNGEPIGLDQVDDLTVSVDLGEDGAPIPKLGDGGKAVSLQYCTDAQGTNTGEHMLLVAGSYTDEYGNKTVGSAQKAFSISEDGKALAVIISTDGDYYLIKNLGDGTPIYLTIMSDGVPITDEEMNLMMQTPGSIVLTTDEGINIDTTWTPMFGESTFKAEILKDGTEAGIHTVNAKVSLNSKNQLYTPAEAEGQVEIKKFPAWVTILAIILAILLLAALLTFIGTRKVLPMYMETRKNDTKGESDGGQLGFKAAQYSGPKWILGRMTKDATIMIQSQKDGGNKTIPTLTFDFKRKSPLWKSLFKPDECYVEATLREPNRDIKKVKIDSTVFVHDDEKNKLVDKKGKLATDQILEMSDGSRVDIWAEIKNNSGFGTRSMHYKTNVHMKWRRGEE